MVMVSGGGVKGGRSGAVQKLQHSTVRILTDIPRRSMNPIFLLHPQSCSAAPALSHGIQKLELTASYLKLLPRPYK